MRMKVRSRTVEDQHLDRTWTPRSRLREAGKRQRQHIDQHHEESSMTTLQDVQAWRGQKAVDANGDKVGTIEDIYLDRASGEPEWAAVKTGLFGSNVSFVPIQDARTGDGDVRLAYTKDQIKDAPNIDADGQLSTQEEQRLYEHYGRGQYEWSGEDRTRELGLADDDLD